MDELNYKAPVATVLACIYLVLLLLEWRYPLRQRKRAFLPRTIINMSFTAVVYITALILVSPAVAWVLGFTESRHIGIIAYIQPHPLLSFTIGFLLLDLSFYYWHRLNHQWPLLWRFHNVHHCDPDLDVTTSMRFHFVEIAYSSIFRILQLIIIAPNLMTFLVYEFAFQANTFFHHSNLRLPIWFERILNKILVTPRMHGVHHSDYKTETNSNYSVVLSIWDRIHRTIRLNIPQTNISIGVAAYENTKDNKLLNLVIMPFKKQRFYWEKNSEIYEQRYASLSEGFEIMAE